MTGAVRGEAAANRDLALFLNETGRAFGALAEKVFFHLSLQKLSGFRLDGGKAILINQHRLVSEPALPRELGDAIEDSLAQLTRVRRPIEPLGLDPEEDAVHSPAHITLSLELAQRTQ